MWGYVLHLSGPEQCLVDGSYKHYNSPLHSVKDRKFVWATDSVYRETRLRGVILFTHRIVKNFM
jgi:hypothetical protein